MKDQKYLIEPEKIAKQYSVISAYVDVASKLIKPSPSTRDWRFDPTGMGRTRIAEELFKGEDPLTFYNKNQTLASKALRRQLLVREFFRQAKQDWTPRRPKSSWRVDPQAFKDWKKGETGHTLIDAGMNQLNYEGFMPNRVRQLCASFLTKNLGIWWEDGAEYFEKKLIDYNEYSNTGNWQWVSGVGFNSRLTDVVSPILQLNKFGKDYAKLWLPKSYSPDPGKYDYFKTKARYISKINN